MGDAADLAQRLGQRAAALAAELLPAGRREGAEWRCGNVAGEPGRSLAVHLTGAKAGIWSDFTTGEAGDALDLVAAVRFRGDRGAALAWARHWLGLGTAPQPAPAAAVPAREAAAADAGAEAARKRAAAQRLFRDARPSLAGTPAALYLAARGIDLATLGRQPASLRYHPSLWNAASRRPWPALVAAVTDAAGAHVATHRTWLAQDAAGIWRKAPLPAPKMSLGSVAGGCIRLSLGTSGRPLAEAPAGETAAIAEGIETALSVVIACPDLRVLSAVSLPNMARVVLPPAVRTVILCADNDGDNDAARRSFDRAVQHFLAEGRTVRVARPPPGLKDLNDALNAPGEATT